MISEVFYTLTVYLGNILHHSCSINDQTIIGCDIMLPVIVSSLAWKWKKLLLGSEGLGLLTEKYEKVEAAEYAQQEQYRLWAEMLNTFSLRYGLSLCCQCMAQASPLDAVEGSLFPDGRTRLEIFCHLSCYIHSFQEGFTQQKLVFPVFPQSPSQCLKPAGQHALPEVCCFRNTSTTSSQLHPGILFCLRP